MRGAQAKLVGMDAFPDPGPDALVYILSHDPEPLPTIRAFVEAFGVDQLHRLQLRNDITNELWDARVKAVCVDCEDQLVAIDLAASGLEWLVVDLQARAARGR